MKACTSVLTMVKGSIRIDTSLVANGFASGLIWGTAARVVEFVKPMLFVTLAIPRVAFWMEKLLLLAGSKCSTCTSSRGTLLTLRISTKSPIMKVRPVLFFLPNDVKKGHMGRNPHVLMNEVRLGQAKGWARLKAG